VAQIRYALHTLVFDESNEWQKRWALYMAGSCCELIIRQVKYNRELRLDYLPLEWTNGIKIGMTILPGRKDWGRNLDEDIQILKKNKISALMVLVTLDELEQYGVDNLIESYQKQGFKIFHNPIIDQGVPSISDVDKALAFLNRSEQNKENVVIHCVGGLGRTGLMAACYLKSKGLDTEEAMAMVRKIRESRAIESEEQEEFVREYRC
jgi:protein-tyrosine phosphatase